MSAADTTDLRALVERCVLDPLALLRRRLRLGRLLDGAVRLMLLAIVVAAAQMLLDRWLHLTLAQRAVVDAVVLGVFALATRRWLVRPWRTTPDIDGLAVIIDRLRPELRDATITAVQFGRGEVGPPTANSPALLDAALRQACARLTDVDFLQHVDHRRLRRRAVQLAGLLAVAVASLAALPQAGGIWFRRNWLLQQVGWPRQTHLEPLGFDRRGVMHWPRGEELVIEVANHGRVPRTAALEWFDAQGRTGREQMVRVGRDRWQVSVGRLNAPLKFRLLGGDERTRLFTAVPVERPRVSRAVLRVQPPAYTGVAPLSYEHESVIEVPRGSVLEIEAVTNVALRRAEFVGGDGQRLPLVSAEPRKLTLRWPEPQDGNWWFELEDEHGWTNLRPLRYTLRVLPDRPPAATCSADDLDELVTAAARVPLHVELSDDYGVVSAQLWAGRNEEPPVRLPLEGFEPGRRRWRGDLILPLERLKVGIGQTLTISVTATDGDPTAPHTTRSRALRFRVVSRTEFLAAVASRTLALRRDFQRLVGAQRGLQALCREVLAGADEKPISPEERRQRLLGLARSQEMHARGVSDVARGLSRVLRQMSINDVARPGEPERWRRRIVTPLEQLAADVMPVVARELQMLADSDDSAAAVRVLTRLAETVARMKRILAAMQEWESYRETVGLLEEIIAGQRRLHQDTLQALQRQLEDVLEIEDLFESPPASAPAAGEPQPGRPN